MEHQLQNEQIYKTLLLVDGRFSQIDFDNTLSTNSQLELMLLSKLSVIEFCGWVEVSIDDILTSYLTKKPMNHSVLIKSQEEIDQVYGCSEENIRRLFRRILGSDKFSDFLQSKPYFQVICSHVEAIGGTVVLQSGDRKRKRDIAAHTPTNPISQTYFAAPSLVMEKLRKVHPLLLKLESDLATF